jgi:hypothetical protein
MADARGSSAGSSKNVIRDAHEGLCTVEEDSRGPIRPRLWRAPASVRSHGHVVTLKDKRGPTNRPPRPYARWPCGEREQDGGVNQGVEARATPPERAGG